MFALSSTVDSIILYVLIGLITAAILGLGRAFMKWTQGKQTKVRQNADTQRLLTEYLFDTPSDPIARTPARIGWTSKVDLALENLQRGQDRIEKAVHLTLSEVVPDGNGGHNMRGGIDRLAEAASADVKRIRNREDGP